MILRSTDNAMETQSPPPRSDAGNGRHDEPSSQDDARNPASKAFEDVPIWIAELKSHFRYFVSAKIDGVKAKVKLGVLYVALGVVALLILAGLLFSAAFLLLSGLAMGLGQLLGSRLWLGNLIVGLVVLAGVVACLWLMMKKITHAGLVMMEKKYDDKQRQQRAEFGRDVHQRGSGSASAQK